MHAVDISGCKTSHSAAVPVHQMHVHKCTCCMHASHPETKKTHKSQMHVHNCTYCMQFISNHKLQSANVSARYLSLYSLCYCMYALELAAWAAQDLGAMPRASYRQASIECSTLMLLIIMISRLSSPPTSVRVWSEQSTCIPLYKDFFFHAHSWVSVFSLGVSLDTVKPSTYIRRFSRSRVGNGEIRLSRY